MSDDLHARLARAARQIEDAAPALEGGRLGEVRSAARRGRVVRRTAESFAAVGVVGALGVGLWFGLGQHVPEPVVPVVTPTVAPTPTPTPSVTPTPSATPPSAEPPTRAESIDDATVIARLSAPRTGEVWQTPVRTPEVDVVLLGEEAYGAEVFLVGTRADASIYIAVGPDSYGTAQVTGLYEIDAAGARLIACPGARTGDACAGTMDRVPDMVPDIERDETTFYDTTTLPRAIDLGNGFVVRTARTTGEPHFAWNLYGDGLRIVSDEPRELRTVRALGEMSLVSEEHESYGPEVSSFRYALRMPYGSLLILDPGDVPGSDFSAIRWDAGFAPDPPAYESEVSVAPAVNGCSWARLSRDTNHVDSQWRAAGTTVEGRPVFVPVEGGSPIASTVRAWQAEHSWTYVDVGMGNPDADEHGLVQGPAAGYPYLTDTQFLTANALYAVEGPEGEWLLSLRQGALSVIYECS